MQVCVTFRQGDVVPEELLLGNTPETEFGLTTGAHHTVYAVSVWRHVVHYLLLNQRSGPRPDWYPAYLFEITDPKLPWGWSMVRAGADVGLPVELLFGYEELAQADGRHYIDLIERVPEALAVFERRREMIDNTDD